MPHSQHNLFTRPDTMLGICQGLGEDFGFSPTWLRVGLAILLYFNPAAAVGAYAAGGAIVLVSRLAFPKPRKAPAAAATQAEALPEPEPLPLAA